MPGTAGDLSDQRLRCRHSDADELVTQAVAVAAENRGDRVDDANSCSLPLAQRGERAWPLTHGEDRRAVLGRSQCILGAHDSDAVPAPGEHTRDSVEDRAIRVDLPG